jgi:hypothetical protein
LISKCYCFHFHIVNINKHHTWATGHFFAKSQKLKKVCGSIKKKTSGKKAKALSTKEKSLTSRFTLLAASLKAQFQSPKPLGSHVLAVLHWSPALAVPAVLLWLSVLSLLPCPAVCPAVLAILSWQSCHGSPVLAVLCL